MTNDQAIADKIRLMRDHGRGRNNEIELWGFNCRMDNLQAAILDLKLKKVPEWINRRRKTASIYHKGLSGIEELLLPSLPVEDGPFFDVFQNYEIEAERRDELRSHLSDKGIETMITWGGKGVHQFKALAFTKVKLPRTEELFKKVLMLPMHPDLTDEQVGYVVNDVRDFYGRSKS